MLNNFYQRFQRMQNGSNPVNASDVADDLVSTPSTPFRVAAGTGTMVTGTLTITTGLNSVVAFIAQFNANAGTGTAANQLIIGVATTGSVVATAYYTSTIGASGALAAASGATGAFSWFAIGS